MGVVFDGTKMRAIAKEKGMSAEEMASQLGITPITVYHYLLERKNPSLPKFVAISRMLGVPMEELVKKEGSIRDDEPSKQI